MKTFKQMITELYSKTLSSYIKDASQSAAHHAHVMGKKQAQSDEVDRFRNRLELDDQHKTGDMLKMHLKSTPDHIEKERFKLRKRLRGIEKATDKLSKRAEK